MSDTKKPEILDLDAIKPAPRQVKLGEKQIDVTVIPFDVMLDVTENIDRFQVLAAGKAESAGGKELKSVLELLYRTTLKVCQHADPEVTQEWLSKNVDVIQMVTLMGFIVRPLFEKVGDSKNLLLAELVGGSE